MGCLSRSKKMTTDQKVVRSNRAGCMCLDSKRLRYELLLNKRSYKDCILAIFEDSFKWQNSAFSGWRLSPLQHSLRLSRC